MPSGEQSELPVVSMSMLPFRVPGLLRGGWLAAFRACQLSADGRNRQNSRVKVKHTKCHFETPPVESLGIRVYLNLQ
jgi:hypothetical protein